MFLKKIELVGFKSFPDPLTIDFVPGVTAIVGPNGSGKSNIIDAIRWVLGEQSAKSLRGQKMEDVIFSGSDTRRAVNVAEVTLVLDNESGQFPLAYSEIAVKRKVTRSGDSSFYLNGEVCRLKDILDLFVDSGVGKAAFSIISQGRVDEVLNSNAKERRLIFDEVAGVLKYRKQKEEATRKLNQTSEHLDRVLDILNELNQQLEPLRLSSEKAKRAEQLDKEIAERDLRLLRYETYQLTEAYERHEQTIHTLEQQLEKWEAEEQRMREEREQLTETRERALDRRDTLSKHISTVETKIEKWEGRKRLKQEQTKHKRERVEQLQFTFQSTSERRRRVERQLAEERAQYEQLLERYEEAQHRLTQLEKTLDTPIDELERELETLKATYIDELNEEATIRNDLKHLDRQLEDVTQQSFDDEEKKRLHDALMRAQSTLTTIQQRHDELQQRASHLQKERQEAEQQYETLRDRVNQQEALVTEANEKLIEWTSRQHVLESIEQQFKNFNTSVQEVLKASERQQLTGIVGAVSQLVEAKEERFVQAIEIALGAASQQIVTQDESSAKRAIHYLKQRSLGRATFLPQSTMKSRLVSSRDVEVAASQEGFVGVASTLMTFDAAYTNVVEHITGRTLVATTLDAATDIAKRLNYRYRIVTLEGDVVNSGGSLTGGRGKGRPSPFMQKAELQSIRERVMTMQQQLKKARETMSETKSRMNEQFERSQRLNVDVTATGRSIQQVEIERVEAKTAWRQAQVDYQQYVLQFDESSERIETLQQNRRATMERHRLLREQLQTLNTTIQSKTELLAERRTEQSAMTEQYYKCESTLQLLNEQKLNAERTVRTLQEECRTLEETERQTESELHLITHDEVDRYSEEEIERQVDQLREEMERAERELASHVQQLRRVTEQLESSRATYERLTEQLQQAHKTLTEERVQFAKVETELIRYVEALRDRYGVTGRITQCPPIDEIEVERAEVATLKEQREAIGPVDPATIVQYEEVLERHTFLSEQRTDLIEAKVTLQLAMEEMDHEVEERFHVTFEAVRHYFRDMFSKMFGGGEADLVLTDPSNLLETGVDIIARPPGKKLQHLSLLSGGERALTAITLLFALIEVRPVPFCILDEVEAALDEVNVLRYSDYLKHFSQSTQFIVITHRKGTMEGADVLYGVTMEEAGVSTMLSVQLSEVEKKIG